MALVNPNIAMSFRQPEIQVPNALAQYAQLQQIQSGQQAQELNALKLQEAQAASVNRNSMRGLDFNAPDYVSQVAKYDPKLASEIAKERATILAQETAQKKSAFDLKAAQRKFGEDLKRGLSANPSDENIIAFGQDAVLQGLYTPEQVNATVSQLLALPVQERAQILALSGASAAELKPQVVAPGSTLVQGGKPVFTAPERQDTDLIRNYNAAKAQGFAGTLFDYERKIKEAGRTPAQPVAPTITQIVDPANPNRMITIDARRYTGGTVGSPGVLGVGGKEPSAAARENKAEIGKTQLADDLDNLRASFARLDEMRAIPSTARNPLSNIASATAATGIGQTAGRFVGTEAQVEREVINSARTRLVNSIKNATGMSAQQLNSNVELQTMLKSISDPGQPIEAALRIIDDIENAYVRGAGMPKKNAPGAGAKPAPAATSSGATVSNW